MATREKTNIVLIGMPGAGKSTVGVLLAKKSRRNFIDTDLLIQSSQQQTLQEIVDAAGDQQLRRIEEQILIGLNCEQTVIATGGSAVYSHAAMQHLAETGDIVFLSVPLSRLAERLGNFATRGIARRPGQSLAELFDERQALYLKYARLTVDGSHGSADQIAEEICSRLAEGKS